MMSYAFNFQGKRYDSLRHFQKNNRRLTYDQIKSIKHVAESKEHFIELLESAIAQIEAGSTRINFAELSSFPKVQLSFLIDSDDKEETIVSIDEQDEEVVSPDVEPVEDLTDDELYNSFPADELDQRKVVIRRNGIEVEVPFKSNELDNLVKFIKQL